MFTLLSLMILSSRLKAWPIGSDTSVYWSWDCPLPQNAQAPGFCNTVLFEQAGYCPNQLGLDVPLSVPWSHTAASPTSADDIGAFKHPKVPMGCAWCAEYVGGTVRSQLGKVCKAPLLQMAHWKGNGLMNQLSPQQKPGVKLCLELNTWQGQMLPCHPAPPATWSWGSERPGDAPAPTLSSSLPRCKHISSTTWTKRLSERACMECRADFLIFFDWAPVWKVCFLLIAMSPH